MPDGVLLALFDRLGFPAIAVRRDNGAVRVTQVADAYCELSGRSAEYLMGRPISELHRHSIPLDETEGRVRHVELFHADGTTRALAEIASLPFDSQGSELRLVFPMARTQENFGESSHRTKNAIQNIAAMLSIQARRANGDEAKHILDDAIARLWAMSEVHNLLYHDGAKSTVDMRSYLGALCEALHRSAFGARSDSIRLQFSAVSSWWPIDAASQVGMLLCEVLMNASKYAFADRATGLVKVSFYPCDADRFCLEMEDDGKGFIQRDSTAGFGQKLVAAVARQLGGTVDIRSSPDNGTTVRVTLARPALAE